MRISVEPAICDSGGARRSTARSIWASHLTPAADLIGQARTLIERCPLLPGRVHSLGEFEDAAVHQMIAATLPGDRELHLRARFEWYACRGAGFHNDAHYADVLFGAWCIAGPSRDIVFPRIAARLNTSCGDLAIFDPFEPHAVLDPGHREYARDRYDGATPSVFVAFEIALDPAACAVFGVAGPPDSGSVLSSSIPINAETGALP